MGLILLAMGVIGQTATSPSKSYNDEKLFPRTYFTPLIRAGVSNLNYGSNNSSVMEYKKSATGIQAGFSLQYGFAPKLSLLSEIYYARKGGTLKGNNPLTNNETSYRFNSIELPVLARLHLGRVHLNAGPSITYNVAGKQKDAGKSKAISFGKADDAFKRFEAGIGMGGGFTFFSKRKQFVFDMRYNHGLTDISNDKDIYNRGITLSLISSKVSHKSSKQY